MQGQIFWLLNGIFNDLIIELLPFLTLTIKDNFRKNKYLIYVAINVFDILFFWRQHPPTICHLIFLYSMPFIITAIFFQSALWKKIVLSIIYDLIVLGCEFAGAIYLFVFLDGTYDDLFHRNTPNYYAASTFNNMLYFIFVFLTVIAWKYFINKEKGRHFLLFIGIIVYQFVLTGIFISFSVDYSTPVMWLGLLLVIMNFTVDLIVFFFLKRLEKRQLAEAELMQLAASRKRELARYKDIEAQLKTLREQRHEFANQIQTTYMMIEQNVPTEQIVQYLSNILDNIT